MYHSYLKDVKRKKLKLYSPGQKEDMFTRYSGRCELINVPSDKFVCGLHRYGFNEDTLWYMINAAICVDNIMHIMSSAEDASIWFRRVVDKAPFFGISPLQYVQENATNAPKLRFYTNGLIADYYKYETAPLLDLPDPSEFSDEYIDTID